MSKQEESKFDKLKHFLGIGAHRGTHGSALAGSIRPTTREFIFTDDLLKVGVHNNFIILYIIWFSYIY